MADALQPQDLSQIMLTGAVYQGKPITRIVIVFDGGKLTTLLPTGDDPTPTEAYETPEQAILRILGNLTPGAYISGRALAAEIGLTYGAGRFLQLIGQLKQENLIESHKAQGYRLKQVK